MLKLFHLCVVRISLSLKFTFCNVHWVVIEQSPIEPHLRTVVLWRSFAILVPFTLAHRRNNWEFCVGFLLHVRTCTFRDLNHSSMYMLYPLFVCVYTSALKLEMGMALKWGYTWSPLCQPISCQEVPTLFFFFFLLCSAFDLIVFIVQACWAFALRQRDWQTWLMR